MPPIPVKPGPYKFYAHIIGPPALLTAREHAIDHGLPTVTDRPLPHPLDTLHQEWTIEPLERGLPGSPYVIYLGAYAEEETQNRTGLIVVDHKVYANTVPRDQLTKFIFEPGLGGLQIVDDKDHLALRAGHLGQQIEAVTPNKADPHQVWTLHSPIGL
ncbi:hypothetical protein [Streptomyces albireticuli]|uniref:Ricin B lectin domain-containing protein n=1 Tax=Streptomyces albireticuli TaxID=1940 RepID=A0A2A2D9B1_9ACTN|nr:hypothetical protein [Streptomyces albireticuli]MCD9140566.1 hypothetical protein [Streptomyces albireticuli]MCD9161472.1 hypothetical protein [Streptomyces albireticuli]MCD9192958.1 hypothetical protein [Streptomyces albireticuli]PAU48071.1 hypothetical protein CK936_15175 [Streptomyces albireticuli]